MNSAIFKNNTAVTFRFIKDNRPETSIFVSLCPCDKVGCDIRFANDKNIKSWFVALGGSFGSHYFYSKSDALHCLGLRLLDLVTRGYTFTVKVDNL